jgi:hypothetical protein
MMAGFLPAHQFVPHPHDRVHCGAPDHGDVCGQPADNPTHRFVDRPDVNELTAALAAYPWQKIAPRSWVRLNDCPHGASSPCGVCAGDLHAISAAVTDIRPAPDSEERVHAALDVLGWPDDRYDSAHVEPDGFHVTAPGHYWELVVEVLLAADRASAAWEAS